MIGTRVRWVREKLGSLQFKMLVYFLICWAGGMFFLALYATWANQNIWWKDYYYFYYLPLILFVVVFVLLFLILTRPMIRKLYRLVDDLQIIATGNLAHRANATGMDELSRVAVNLNDMAQQLEDMFDRELQLERSKVEFITNISHDIRTPLTSVVGYLRLMKSGACQNEAEERYYLNVAFQRALQLQGLIEDLFEYSKLASGDLPLERRLCNLTELLHQVIGEMVTVSSDSSAEVQKHVPATPVLLLIDVEKMVRVFENLLSNALKYSRHPRVIHLDLQEAGEEVRVAFTNRTEPISPADRERLFDRFFRVEPSRNHHTGGSGLGLSICKSILELHGGRMWMEYQEPDLIRFVVALPKTK
ncbi:HAMP domain-containing histidine kinase [Tumebacillus sp. ITR2]|uniref:histidine kinase n=1 Tax=Tumebacillus amylolyticus TaxID=2801339 RepID=A0ABS1JFS0_9BACL|nr:HAMP domain-containing sensor histidine kinase [Tumebacillus amylolyticus]MBL0389131.1 HAMP domain-containing histidine kinase [Tumebacillus amylolyticus]